MLRYGGDGGVDISDKANPVLDVTLKFSSKEKGNKEMILRGVRIYRLHDNIWSYQHLCRSACGYKLWLRLQASLGLKATLQVRQVLYLVSSRH